MGTQNFAKASQMIIENPSQALRYGLLFALAADDGSVIATLDNTDDAEMPENSSFVTKFVASNDGGFASFMTVPHEDNLKKLRTIAKKTNADFKRSNLEFDKDGHITGTYAAPPTTSDTQRVLDAILVYGNKVLTIDGMTEINGQPLRVVDYQFTKYLGALRIHLLTANNEIYQLRRIEQALDQQKPSIMSYTRIRTDVNALVTMPGTVQGDRILYATNNGIQNVEGKIVIPQTKDKSIPWMTWDHSGQVLIWGVGTKTDTQVYTGLINDTNVVINERSIVNVQLQIKDLAAALRKAGASTSTWQNIPPSQIFSGPALDGNLLVVDWKRKGSRMVPTTIQVPFQASA